MYIKIQYKKLTVNSLIESGFENLDNKLLTYHAFSNKMKAKILEGLLTLTEGSEIHLTIMNDEQQKTGEWQEERDINAKTIKVGQFHLFVC